MITLDSISKYFGTTKAVDNLSLEFPDGEICCLVGPSGCGKTTTLRMINRLIEPSRGRILIDGRDITALPAHELRRGIGYVIQQTGLFPHRTVAGNIATVPKLLGWDEARIRNRVGELQDLIGLPRDLLGRYPAELSGGQQQRVGVARALAADPPVLLMDEPFGAVDPIVRARLQDELAGLQQTLRKTIVFVTHDIDEAIKLADRIAILNVGGVLEQYASPEELLSAPANDFIRSFLGAERGLKRLSLKLVGEVELDPGPVLDSSAQVSAAESVMAFANTNWVGVLESGKLLGWVWASDLMPDRTMGEHQLHEFVVSVQAKSNLREALDAIVNSRNQVAVVLDEAHYLGMLFLDRISKQLLE